MTRLSFCFLLLFSQAIQGADSPVRALIIDGRNNHDWRSTTDHLRATLEATDRFEVSVSTAPELRFPRIPHRSTRPENEALLREGQKLFQEPLAEARQELQKHWDAWLPDFASCDVVVLNYNGEHWPTTIQEAFLTFVREGGGVVLVHGSNNSFRNWPEFNEMIGLGYRPAPIGRAIKISPDTGATYVANDADLIQGGNSGHGSKHPFKITVRATQHPVMKGLPPVWKHASDELYHNMRGATKGLTVLSSAFSDPEKRGSGEHEPITWEVAYGKGRVIVTSLGHLWNGGMERGEQESLQCLGFQTIFARSCEYAGTGSVTLPVPSHFPGPDETSTALPHEVTWFSANPSPGESPARQRMEQKKKTTPTSC